MFFSLRNLFNIFRKNRKKVTTKNSVLIVVLTLVFVLLGQYEAVGFIIAAKSLLRFAEGDKAKSEYVLIGTLLSFSMAIFVGVAIKLYYGL